MLPSANLIASKSAVATPRSYSAFNNRINRRHGTDSDPTQSAKYLHNKRKPASPDVNTSE
jgi:hypothetical protein